MQRRIVPDCARWLALAAVLSAAAPRCCSGAHTDWPRWLGPSGNGVAAGDKIPTQWSETKNVRWKLDLGCAGNSSPIVWGERIFLTGWTGAAASVETFVLCIEREKGALLWKTRVPAPAAPPARPPNPENGWATPTPVTDGHQLAVAFGTGTLAYLNVDGTLLWSYDLGPIRHKHGLAASPAMDATRVYYTVDQATAGGLTYVVAIDRASGKNAWRIELDAAQGPGPGYTTPVLHEFCGVPQLVVWAVGQVGGYDRTTGAVLWRTKGLVLPDDASFKQPIGTPVCAENRVYLSQWDWAMAVELARPADAFQPKELWSLDRAGGGKSGRCSGLVLYGKRIYAVSDRGEATCYHTDTGKALWSMKLDAERLYANGVAAAGHVIFTTRKAESFVFRAGDKAELVATNKLPGACTATPAIAGNRLFFRTADKKGLTTLWSIGD